MRDKRVKSYFYGGKIPLHPFSFDVKWSDLRVFKIGAPALPDSCMPLGMKPEDNMTKLVAVQPGKILFRYKGIIRRLNSFYSRLLYTRQWLSSTFYV